ncbi:hypothetical protein ESB00_03530 [Oleiharenicola lentus]|uniref:Uncharacterized protein n=1 Tax=Oleiharenicola lentus TaxID=2508720 RepID=A0A4Q1C856_9BACT|nr:hypothetical protein [Oleiharenicola lentus]RXK54982.1 hypothetical protein ESB00_03530 [Oleiharenicola lentus]
MSSNIQEAVGRVVMLFQVTERNLTDVLAKLLSARSINERHVFLGALSFGQKVDLYSALVHQRGTKQQWSICRHACRYLLAAEAYRNSIVHSDYSPLFSSRDPDAWLKMKVTIRGGKGLKLIKRVVNAKDIDSACDVMSTTWVYAVSELKDTAKQEKVLVAATRALSL